MLNKNLLNNFLSKIKYLILLSLTFFLFHSNIIYAAKIKNCSNCGDNKTILNDKNNIAGA